MRLSILALTNYNSEIWDPVTFPEGIDKQTAINQIMIDCSDMELLYPNGDLMKIALKQWADVNRITFEKMLYTQTATYDPIENYDRHSDITETNNGESNGTDNVTTTTKVSAYNVSSYEPDNEVTGNSRNNIESNNNMKRTEHVHGNIGITSAMDLIKQEREVADFSIYKFISNSFKKEFCILTY